MGRTLMYTAIGALLLLVLSSVFLLDHGGAHIPQGGAFDANAAPQEVTLHDLTITTGIQQYEHHNVETTGTLYFNSQTNRHVIVDKDSNYQVVVKWDGGLGQFEGQQVVVIGAFGLVPGAGPTIQATAVRLNGSVTPTPKDI